MERKPLSELLAVFLYMQYVIVETFTYLYSDDKLENISKNINVNINFIKILNFGGIIREFVRSFNLKLF